MLCCTFWWENNGLEAGSNDFFKNMFVEIIRRAFYSKLLFKSAKLKRLPIDSRVARFYLVQHTKTEKYTK
jgi:hypothetical protein